MYSFSKRSFKQFNRRRPDEKLVLICNELIKRIDFTVIEGYRTRERQRELFDKAFLK